MACWWSKTEEKQLALSLLLKQKQSFLHGLRAVMISKAGPSVTITGVKRITSWATSGIRINRGSENRYRENGDKNQTAELTLNQEQRVQFQGRRIKRIYCNSVSLKTIGSINSKELDIFPSLDVICECIARCSMFCWTQFISFRGKIVCN